MTRRSSWQACPPALPPIRVPRADAAFRLRWLQAVNRAREGSRPGALTRRSVPAGSARVCGRSVWTPPWPPGLTPPTARPRLLHYFRGRHHLEEIMYNENTRRSQLLMLLDKFRSVLVVTTHEDPVIAVFQALLP